MLFAVGLVLALPPPIFRVVVVDLDMSMVCAPEQADMRAECHEGQYHGEIWLRDRFHAVRSVNTVRRKFTGDSYESLTIMTGPFAHGRRKYDLRGSAT
jgi:hypothetical protein